MLGVWAACLSVTGAFFLSVAGDAERWGHHPHRLLAGVPVVNHEFILKALEGTQNKSWEDWTLYLKPGSSDAMLAEVCKDNPNACGLAGHPGAGGVPFITMRGTEQDLEAFLASHKGRFEFAEPDLEVSIEPSSLPDGAETPSTEQSCSWGLDRVGVPHGGERGKGAHIYMLGTGVRCTHVEFGGRCIPTLDTSSGVAVECDGDIQCAIDEHGHGTHGAATAGGSVCGVATHATVHGVKVLGPEGRGRWSRTISALDWIAAKGARPAVASLGMGGAGDLLAVQRAVERATQGGVTVVVAAGSENEEARRVHSAIVVGAADHRDHRAPYSNYGGALDIFAPGSRITSAWHDSDTGAMTMSGTAAACTHVAGAAALLLARSPSLLPREVAAQLMGLAAQGELSGLRQGDPDRLLRLSPGGPRHIIAEFVDLDLVWLDTPRLQRIGCAALLGMLVAGTAFAGSAAFRAVRRRVGRKSQCERRGAMLMELVEDVPEGAGGGFPERSYSSAPLCQEDTQADIS